MVLPRGTMAVPRGTMAVSSEEGEWMDPGRDELLARRRPRSSKCSRSIGGGATCRKRGEATFKLWNGRAIDPCAPSDIRIDL